MGVFNAHHYNKKRNLYFTNGYFFSSKLQQISFMVKHCVLFIQTKKPYFFKPQYSNVTFQTLKKNG